MKLLEVKDLGVKYGSREAVKKLSFSVEEGEWLMIVGPNGAGKSTAVNAVAQTIPHSGSVSVCGRDCARMKPKSRARLIGVLSQINTSAYDFTAGDIIHLGRYAYSGGAFGSLTETDERFIREAAEMTGTEEFFSRGITTLSGGEQQRVFLAQVFAQNPKILILDEPANHLDILYQKQVFSLVKQWLRGSGRAVVSVVHDLGVAGTFGDRCLLMNDGSACASGSCDEVLRSEVLDSVYSMDVAQWMKTLLSRWQ